MLVDGEMWISLHKYAKRRRVLGGTLWASHDDDDDDSDWISIWPEYYILAYESRERHRWPQDTRRSASISIFTTFHQYTPSFLPSFPSWVSWWGTCFFHIQWPTNLIPPFLLRSKVFLHKSGLHRLISMLRGGCLLRRKRTTLSAMEKGIFLSVAAAAAARLCCIQPERGIPYHMAYGGMSFFL